MRLFVVLQRYLALGQPWMNAMLAGLKVDLVGIAGRTIVTGELERPVDTPFFRLRSRNVVHRLFPKPIRHASPQSGDAILLRALKGSGADRVLCHFGTVAIEHARVWEKVDLPLFVHFHGFDFMFDMREPDGSGLPVHAEDYRSKIVRLSDRAIFIANSQFCAGKLTEAGVDPRRIRVNYIGVDPPAEPVTHLDEARPLILHIGRLLDVKGADLTVKAFTLMRDRGVSGRLAIIGDGPERASVEAAHMESQYRDDIEVMGAVMPAVAGEYLRKASVFTTHNQIGPVSRQEESLNVAILEAMAMGVPVVGTRSGGVVETVVDGETGYLVVPRDIEAQSVRLGELLQSVELRNRMGRAGHERVKQKFTMDQTVAGLRRILG